MPALYVFNRRTIFAGDDLHVPSILTSFAKSCQLFILILPLGIHFIYESGAIIHTSIELASLNNDNDNGGSGGGSSRTVMNQLQHFLFGGGDIYPNSNYNNYNENMASCNTRAHYFPLFLYTFLISSTIHITFSLIFEYLIYQMSSIGNPTQPQLRNSTLSKLIERKWIWSSLLGNIIVSGLGITAWVYGFGYGDNSIYFDCRNGLWKVYEEEYNHNNGDGNDDDDDFENGNNGKYDMASKWFGKHAWWIAFILLFLSQMMELIFSVMTLVGLLQNQVKHQHRLNHHNHEQLSNSYYQHPNDTEDNIEDNTTGTTTNTTNTSGVDDTIQNSTQQQSYPPTTPHHQQHQHHELSEEMWNKRCRTFCKCAASSTCYLFGGRDLVDGVVGDYGQVSRALADYFEDGGVLDIVTSDIVAGFMMLQRRQRQRILAARKRINDDLKFGHNHDGGLGNYNKLDPKRNGARRISSTGSLSSSVVSGNRGDIGDGGNSYVSKSSSSIGLDEHNFGLGLDKKINGLYHEMDSTTNININNDHTATLSNPIGLSQYQNQGILNNENIIHQYHNHQEQEPHQHQQITFNNTKNNDVLQSILQPMQYTSTLLLPNNQYMSHMTGGSATSSAIDFLNIPTAAWTLKKVATNDSNSGEENYQAQQRRVFNRNDVIDTNIIAEGARFARHSLSIYTWVLYVYMKPFVGPSNLIYNRISEFLQKCRSSNSSSSSATNNNQNRTNIDGGNDGTEESDSFFCNIAHGNTVGDNFFHIHRNSLLAHSGLEESDLIYANFNNKYNQMPYCIVIDHRWHSVVLAIRGTLSLEDCLTDVLLEPDPLDELGREHNFDGSGQYCHSGVLSCVKYILNDLKRHDILGSLLTGIGAPFAHYTLRITGHSLGGGCAILLGYILRHKYPNLKVVAISPPAILSWKLATECKDFVTSFVLDSDLVPRLSFQAMEQLRDDVLEMLCRIKVPKLHVVQTFILNGIFRSHEETNDPEKLAYANDQILHKKENIPTDTEFYHQVEKFKSVQKERKEKRGEYRNIYLFPPGNMIHLVKIDERRTCKNRILKCMTCCTTNNGYTYTPVYVNNDDFDEITITPTMGFDHFPNRICLELERVAETFGIDNSLGSSERDFETAERLRQNNASIF